MPHYTTAPDNLTDPPVSEFSAACPPALSRPRKVMLIHQDFGVMGGIERYLLQMAKLLSEDAHFYPVVLCSADGPLFRQLQQLNINVAGLPNRPFFSRSFLRTLDLPSLIEIFKLLKLEQPDLVHVHMGLQENLLWRMLGFPVIYTFHGYGTLFSLADVHSPVKRAVKRLFRACFRQTIRRMDAVLVVSDAERQRLRAESYLPEDCPAEVVHNGMYIDEWQARVAAADRPALRQQWGIPDGAACVAYYNRLDFNKNPLHFVELAHRLTTQAQAQGAVPPFFIMAGDGPMEPEVRAASRGLCNFNYIGLCENVPALLAVADLVIHPASREGFGLGVVEAMAAGVPLLAYDCGGPREILSTPGTGHLLVPVSDVDALTRQASQLLAVSGAERKALQIALQQRATDFSIERFKEKMTHVYQRLLPLVSVILPVYNGEETILRAVVSVLNQSYPHLELIVVDDGSSDTTLALLATVRDDRLRVISQANQGVAVARNFAFEHAGGEWIAFIDADDLWLPQKLARELATLRRKTSVEQPECLIYSGYFAVDEQDVLIHKPPVNRLNGDLSQAVLEQEGLFLPSTALVHRRIFEAVGGFKPGCYHEDRVFFIEACRQFPAFATGERLVLYRQSLSGRCRSVLKNYEQALEAELSIVETLRPSLAAVALERLAALQKRNLLYRFLMYNYLAHARRLATEIRTPGASQTYSESTLFQGHKGRLAKLSLRFGVNFLFAARLFIQGLTRIFLAPFWDRVKRNRSGAAP